MIAEKPSIAVVDDEPNMGKILSKVFIMEGYEVHAFDSPVTALPVIAAGSVDVVLSDLRMPGMTGEEMLEKLRAQGFAGEIILMTAYATVESAMRCVRAGAFDYVTKPFETKSLLATVKRAVEKARRADRQRSTETIPATTAAAPASPNIHSSIDKELIGNSPEMATVRDLIRRIAPSEASVLVTGESGTGKELAARAIHRASARAAKRFVAINCASIPETLIESELFGHEKGSFTGANEAKQGLLEAADGGTLFLDEIGELPLALQAKLLRALQEREITRVGSVQNIHVDIRVVAATNRSLSTAVQQNEFREDLYYRLNVLNIRMPALRKRASDIPMLVEKFLREFRERDGLKVDLRIAPDVMQKLAAMEWPGNVRELRNYVERLTVLSEGPLITMQVLTDLSTYESQTFKAIRVPPGTDDAPPRDPKEISDVINFRHARDRFEAEYIKKVLRSCGGNVSEAAKKSGMSRRNFYEKIEKLGIDPSEFKGASE
ncbi:sigma-54-dependent Fis family transcriptional regulator [Candidatus Sumerlaeota bacterium]|nr:sigma-54-dependent Fis family transcriptional regulator [Candidatus Sumerlaeota bacterium]